MSDIDTLMIINAIEKARLSKVKFWRCRGALMCSEEIAGVTQDLMKAPVSTDPKETMKFYGGQYFVCETIESTAAKIIAGLLGGTYEGEKSADVADQNF